MPFKGNPLPSAVDAARFLHPDVDRVEQLLVQHYSETPPPWSYALVKRLAKAIYSGDLPVEAFKAMLERPTKTGRPRKGIGPNIEVALLLRQHAEGRNFQCFDIKKRRVAISREHSLLLDPPFYFVENGEVKVFWLQPRKGYALNDHQAGALAALLRLSHFRDDFADAKLELYDASAPDGKTRAPRALGLGDLPVISELELTEALSALVRAYERVRYVNFRDEKVREEEKTPDEYVGDLIDMLEEAEE